MKHYLPQNLAKGMGAPFFTPNSGDTGGIYSGGIGSQQESSSFGPRGGHIKGVSPDTGRPIYFKNWSSGQGYGTHDVIDPSAGSPSGGDYQTYEKGGIIGMTSSGLPIHAQANINNTKNFLYDDHKDAHHAHFTMAQYIRNLIQKRQTEGQDISKLNGLYDAHMGFARHHNEEALKDMLHGKAKHVATENLGKRQERSGETIVPMRNIPTSGRVVSVKR